MYYNDDEFQKEYGLDNNVLRSESIPSWDDLEDEEEISLDDRESEEELEGDEDFRKEEIEKEEEQKTPRENSGRVLSFKNFSTPSR